MNQAVWPPRPDPGQFFSPRKYVLNRGQTVAVDDVLVWAFWMEQARFLGKLRIDYTRIGEYRVSTVFLGLDHAFQGGPPLLFETAILSSRPGSGCRVIMRCGTLRTARRMHRHAKLVVRNILAGRIPHGND